MINRQTYPAEFIWSHSLRQEERGNAISMAVSSIPCRAQITCPLHNDFTYPPPMSGIAGLLSHPLMATVNGQTKWIQRDRGFFLSFFQGRIVRGFCPLSMCECRRGKYLFILTRDRKIMGILGVFISFELRD